MGCLDPKLDKKRTVELLRKKGATKAVLQFEGGHDEGGVHTITLTVGDNEVDLPMWYCGGYGMQDKPGGGWEYVPMSTPQNEDEELADLLCGPVDEHFGTWAGAGSTFGTLTWDVETGEAKLAYEQETPREYEYEV